MLHQLISLAGAALILGAYLANSRRWLGPRDRSYNLMNLVGAGLLLWVAVVDQRIGFVILEAAWALIAIPPLLRPSRPGTPDNLQPGTGVSMRDPAPCPPPGSPGREATTEDER